MCVYIYIYIYIYMCIYIYIMSELNQKTWLILFSVYLSLEMEGHFERIALWDTILYNVLRCMQTICIICTADNTEIVRVI